MIGAIVLLYFGFNFLKGIDFFATNHRYYAVYENVDKLAVSNQIFINGFAVGRVSDIEIIQENGNKVVVEMEISSDIVLGDSTVAILTGDFLGGKSILLDIGPIKKQLVPGDTTLSALDRGIADILTQSAVPVADNLQATLRKFNLLVDNLNEITEPLDSLIRSFNSTPHVLNRTLTSTEKNISTLSESFKGVADQLNHTLVDLKPTLANFKVLSDSLKAVQLNMTLNKVNGALTKLNGTLTQMSKKDNTMGKLLTDDALYNNLNKLLLNLDSLANHFNANPKHFMAPLGMSRKKIERELKNQQEAESKKSK